MGFPSNLLLVAALHVTASFTGAAGSCTSEIPAVGGWRYTDGTTPEWLKGSESAACVGACRPVTDEEPFMRIVDGQEVVAPTGESWFKDTAPYWCPTVAQYSTSGSKKKLWAYCACPKTCADITNPAKCVASKYTEEVTKCDFYGGKCFDAPTCTDANSVYTASALANKCAGLEGCLFSKGECKDMPSTCSAVNDAVSSSSSKFVSTCKQAAEGCFVASGKCEPYPLECSALNDMLQNVNGKFRDACAQIPEGCIIAGGRCQALPATCDGLNGLLNNVNNKFKLACDVVEEGCFVAKGQCQAIPSTCQGVNDLDLDKSGNNFHKACLASAEGCVHENDECVKKT